MTRPDPRRLRASLRRGPAGLAAAVLASSLVAGACGAATPGGDRELMVRVVAGLGVAGISGDSGPALDAAFDGPVDVAMGPDGSIVIADTFNNRVRAIAPDGRVDTIAGIGRPGFSGDGGPAHRAQLDAPRGVGVGPDGSVYVADTLNHRVRRIGTDGTIDTVAGTGTAGLRGENGPARDAQLDHPVDVTIGRDGDLLVVDSGNDRVRRIDRDGRIRSLLVSGPDGAFLDGERASDPTIVWPRGVALADDGTVLITSQSTIRSVSRDGTMGLLAGGGQVVDDVVHPAFVRDFVAVDGIVATADWVVVSDYHRGEIWAIDRRADVARLVASDRDGSVLHPFGLALAPDGSLVVADAGRRQIVEIAGWDQLSG